MGFDRAGLMLAEAEHRLVVFTGDLSYSVRRNIIDLDESLPGLSWLVLVHQPKKTVRQVLRNQRLNLKKNGWRWIPEQLREMAARAMPARPLQAKPDAPGAAYEADALRRRPNVRVCHTADVHCQETLAALREFDADLGLSLAAPILKRDLFSLPRLGTINLHKGKLPEFRGMPPAFWEFWTEQSSVGCSVHWVDDKLDAGALLARTQVERERYSTPRGMTLLLDDIGSRLICQVVASVLDGSAQTQEQPQGVAKTYRKPTLAQQSALASRLSRAEPARGPRWQREIKDWHARASLALYRWIGWRLMQPRITVLLYHRVCDDARDNLTVGVAQFERQMRLLRETCTVLSIEQVLEIDRPVRSRRPQVAVSFDDGYFDNYLFAVPALLRHRVPASFFVSTGIVDSDLGFPHDKRRGNPMIPMMTWDQLRRMNSLGFTIGSHTVSHVDCVSESQQKVQEELLQSKDDLSRELGVFAPIFAYPYGGRHQMDAQRLTLVRAAGYQGCLSAYGGSNLAQVDRWNVLRRGIHWEFSDACFLRECLGL